MIFSNIKNIDLTTIDERIKFCVDYFNEHDLINYNAGSFQTDKEDICFRIDELLRKDIGKHMKNI